MGTSFYLPYRTSLAWRSAGHQQHRRTQCRLSCPGLDPEERKSLDPASSRDTTSFLMVIIVLNSAIKPFANKHVIALIHVPLDQVRRENSISIFWTPAHTNLDDLLAQG